MMIEVPSPPALQYLFSVLQSLTLPSRCASLYLYTVHIILMTEVPSPPALEVPSPPALEYLFSVLQSLTLCLLISIYSTYNTDDRSPLTSCPAVPVFCAAVPHAVPSYIYEPYI
ncbi:hypothetical protein J6590_019388 [Homalodisca vitripennis]|nr:hypothetical protein J6590_019388 [Homalodisca vitripennis]